MNFDFDEKMVEILSERPVRDSAEFVYYELFRLSAEIEDMHNHMHELLHIIDVADENPAVVRGGTVPVSLDLLVIKRTLDYICRVWGIAAERAEQESREEGSEDYACEADCDEH